MTRLQVVHRTTFRYPEPATASYNEARMLPRTRDGQFVLQASVETRPATSQHTYTDYWGTTVQSFEMLSPHTELVVTAASVVDLHPARARGARPIGWDEVGNRLERDVTLAEAIRETWLTHANDEMHELAASIRAYGLGIDQTALAVCAAVGEAMTYQRGVTGVQSTASEAWAAKLGVCQDIAHVTLALLRSSGIPARYVSGYLCHDSEARIGEPVIGESHAWVEWYSGTWRAYDPTNLCEIADRHVYVGHGRDYADVTPFRGVYAGPDSSVLEVAVELTRLS